MKTNMKTMKKRIASVSLALVLVLSFTGCGNTIPAMNEKDSEENTGEITEMGGDVTSLDEIIADADELVEQSAEVDKIAEQATEPDETIAPVEAEEPAQTGEPVDTGKPDETKKPAATKKPVETAKPETSASAQVPAQTSEPDVSVQPSATAQPEVPVTTPAPTPDPTPAATPTPEPVHEHSWKEHVATNQVWVPNIVVVDDYEDRVVAYAVCICDCGFETTDADTIKNHIREHAYAGDIKGFTCYDQSYTEKVKVGSHEEDQGHYDTSSYVDYYYCDCGATKN